MIAHTVHVLLAGAWLGGVVFTMFVVSPALGAMKKWGEAERVGVRAVLGRRYARVGGVNLALLVVFALMDGISGGFGVSLYAEYALVPLLFGLVAAQGRSSAGVSQGWRRPNAARRMPRRSRRSRGGGGACRGGST